MEDFILSVCSAVKKASFELARYDTAQKNKILGHIADELIKNSRKILDANLKDLDNAQNKPSHYQDRLRLTPERIQVIANGV
ncbi:MAG: gamma-glutamyl-phosphate reductase, partial [Clostridiales bacterium]|nr:gamma-glutamyl-phosphate reductase [Clostridiales bacterium]